MLAAILQFSCPSCRSTLALPDGSVGKSAQCPSCNAVFPVVELAIENPSFDAIANAVVHPGRTDAVSCPGCDKWLAFDSTSAGHAVICPSCQRRLRMPLASAMRAESNRAESNRASFSRHAVDPTFEDAWSSQTLPSNEPANPYAATNADSTVLRDEANYATPGYLMLIVASSALVFDLLFGLIVIAALAGPIDLDTILGLAMMVTWTGITGTQHLLGVLAGWKMIHRRSLTLCRVGTIVNLIPCGVLCVFVIPIAILATIAVFGSNAVRDFTEPM